MDEYNKKVDPERFTKEKAYIHENRNKMGRCPYCAHNIKDRKVALYKELINSLYQIYCWCGRNRRHEFEVKEIRHLLGKVEYTRFNNLVRFGGLLYKPKEDGKSRRSLFGLNMARAKEFFAGEREIPLQITLDQITGEIIESTYGKVGDFPELSAYLDSNGVYDYESPVQKILMPV